MDAAFEGVSDDKNKSEGYKCKILLLLILLLSTLSTPICNAEEENEGNIGILIIAQQPYSGD